MPFTRSGASSGGDDDTGIDESTSQPRESIPPGSRILSQADIQSLIQAALAVDRATRTEPPTQSEPHISDTINTSGMEKLAGDISLRDFLIWRQQWDDFSDLANLPRRSARIQMATLRTVMSLDMLGTMSDFLNIDKKTEKTTDEVLDAIQGLLRTRRSIFADREELRVVTQGPDEPFDKFFMRIKSLAVAAQIKPDSMDLQLIGSIIGGIRNKKMHKKLISMRPEPSLEVTLALCSGDEYTNRNETSSDRSPDYVYNVAPHHRNNTSNRPRIPSEEDDDPDCGNCGYQSHPPGTTCPAKGKTCDSCGKPNHFASVCRQKIRPANRIGKFYATMRDDSTVTFPPTIGHIRRARTTRNPFGPARQPMSRPTPTRKVVILNSKKPNHVITAIPDTGACTTVISAKLYSQMGRDPKLLTHLEKDDLFVPDGHKLRTAGHTNLQLKYFNKTITTPATVCHGVDGLLLSWFACEDLGIIKWDHPSPPPDPGTTGRRHPPKRHAVRNIRSTDVHSLRRPVRNLRPRKDTLSDPRISPPTCPEDWRRLTDAPDQLHISMYHKLNQLRYRNPASMNLVRSPTSLLLSSSDTSFRYRMASRCRKPRRNAGGGERGCQAESRHWVNPDDVPRPINQPPQWRRRHSPHETGQPRHGNRLAGGNIT